MIPVLYEPKTKKFDSNGIGRLSDAVSCIVTEARNGEYELEMQYPITGAYYKEIKLASVILAQPGDRREAQPFSIYKISRPIRGIVTVYAQHISYQLSYIPCGPFEATGVADALAGLKNHAAEECPYEFWTDKTTGGNFKVTVPSSIRSRLGGTEGSILDVYGGEYEFDMFTVRLWKARGTDKGVTLKYGKNITDLKQEEAISNTITGIYPYWTDGQEKLVTLPEKILTSDMAENFPYPRTVPVDLSAEFEEQPDVDDLREAAYAYMNSHNIGVPTVSIDVSFYPTEQAEGEDVNKLQAVQLCDTVTVEYEKLGVKATAKVIKTVYNVLKEKYDSVSIGEARTSLADTLVAQKKQLAEVASPGFLDAAIANATGWITGVNGGYVIMHKNAEGQPYEILIMNTSDIETATKVWRWNQNGWGYSSNGYAGPYKLAATIDGAIVADFITTGTMQANRISGGTLTLGGGGNGNGVCIVLNDAGEEVARIDSDGIQMYSGLLNIGELFSVDIEGNVVANSLTSNNAEIKGGSIDIETGYRTSKIKLNGTNGSDKYSINITPSFLEFLWTGSNTIRTRIDAGTIEGSSSGAPGSGFSIDPVNAEFYNLTVNNAKHRAVQTKSYGRRLLDAYETAEPYFGDLGFGQVGEDGSCIVDIDPVFAETVSLNEYMVYLQAEGPGELYVEEKCQDRFVVRGSAGLKFSYELKAKQKGFENTRLEEKA